MEVRRLIARVYTILIAHMSFRSCINTPNDKQNEHKKTRRSSEEINPLLCLSTYATLVMFDTALWIVSV